MSTVLTKPVLLDETGQAIVGKLDEIKEAIDNGGTEKYPVLIHITSMPSKTSYIAGEQLNLAGMVVKAVFSNNVEYDVTDQCTFSPANGTVLTSSDTSVTATYTWHPTGTSFTATQAITVKGIVGISVATPPTKTDYIINETLDLTGMVVHLDYDDNTYDDITADCTYVPVNGATLDDDTLTAVAISYYEPTLATTLTTSQAISIVIPIYGVEWDGVTDYIMSRTDGAELFTDPIIATADDVMGSSPFDSISPWKDMQIVEDATAGTMVAIPKFYFKWTKDSSSGKLKLQISPVNLEGFRVSPAHMDRGDGQGERDVIYVGRYICNNDNKSGLWTTLQTAPTEKTLNEFNGAFKSMSSDLWQIDFCTYITLCMLVWVEFATWNLSSIFSSATNNDYYLKRLVGCTDDMIYHTGVATSKSRNGGSGKQAQYRHIEGIFTAINTVLYGIKQSRNSLYPFIDLSLFDPSNTNITGAAAQMPYKNASRTGTYYAFAITPGGPDHAQVDAVNWIPFPDSLSTSGSGSPVGMILYNDGSTGTYLMAQAQRIYFQPGVTTSSTNTGRIMKLPNNT